ncbi:MAG: SH3 domain-containing protein [Christensenellales bacterium]
MENKRRVGFAVIAVILLVVFCVAAGGAGKPEAGYSVKTIIDTPLYSDASYESEVVLKRLNANETVEIIGEVIRDTDNVAWIKVRYNSYYEGYVPYGYLYSKAGEAEYDIQVVRATGKSTSEEIKVYRYHDENSDVIAVIRDGEKVNVIIEQEQDYGEFRKIVCNGEFGFVKAENLTAGLTYNQKLAVIIAAGLVGCLIAVVLIVVINKKKGKKKNKK